jgi:hypothetical protein
MSIALEIACLAIMSRTLPWLESTFVDRDVFHAREAVARRVVNLMLTSMSMDVLVMP